MVMEQQLRDLKSGDTCRILDKWIVVEKVEHSRQDVRLWFKGFEESTFYDYDRKGSYYESTSHPMDIKAIRSNKPSAKNLKDVGELKAGVCFYCEEVGYSLFFLCPHPNCEEVGIFVESKDSADNSLIHSVEYSEAVYVPNNKARWSED